MSHLAAMILCGGESRRMGRPKAWLPFGRETLLQRVVNILGSVADPVLVVASPGQNLPTLPKSVEIIHDPIAHRGPLQGLATGLAALPERVEFAYASATDAPFLRPEWVRRLEETIGTNDLVIPHVGGYSHPLAALYRRATVLAAIRELLATNRMRPVFLVDAVKTRVILEEELRDIDPELSTLRNLNTPEDYQQALRDAERS
jgi:molybdenum cofactor guanylyltransferase